MMSWASSVAIGEAADNGGDDLFDEVP